MAVVRPPPEVAMVQPPSFRSVLLQDRVSTATAPERETTPSYRGGSGTHTGTTPVTQEGMDALRRIVDGSVSAVQATAVVPVKGIVDGSVSAVQAPATPTPTEIPIPPTRFLESDPHVPSTEIVAPPLGAAPLVFPKNAPVEGESVSHTGTTSFHPPPLEGGLHQVRPSQQVGTVPFNPPPLEGGLHGIGVSQEGTVVPTQVQVEQIGIPSFGGPESLGVNNPPVAGTQAGTQNSTQTESFVSAQEILDDSQWRVQRWEHHRLQRCSRYGLPTGPVVPLAERLENMPRDTITLPYGLRRTSIGTWITTMEGQSAFYPRRAREYDEWDLDEDNNIRSPFPRHPSFDDTVDEDDYFIDYVSCTSNFSFTAHPEDYEGCNIIPPSSISIRRHASSLEDDVHVAWPMEEEGNDTTPAGDDTLLRLQRDTMTSLALRRELYSDPPIEQ